MLKISMDSASGGRGTTSYSVTKSNLEDTRKVFVMSSIEIGVTYNSRQSPFIPEQTLIPRRSVERFYIGETQLRLSCPAKIDRYEQVPRRD
jgi:hypothetical protein